MANKGYTTEALVEAYLGEAFDGTTTPSSTDIVTFIGWSEKQIDDETGTSFTSATVTDEILDSNGSQRFRLPKRPIISVSAFTVDENGLGAASTNWVARTEGRTNSADFVILEDEGVLYFHNDTPPYGIQNIKTTYAYGYSAIPKDVEKLATLLVTQEIIKARLADNAYSSQDTIRVGPIMISKSGGQVSLSLIEFNKQIDEAWSSVGRFRTIIH